MSEILLTSRRFRVERREYQMPGKGTVHQELVVHPGSVLILPLLDPQTVIMIRNFRYSADRELLELPAGTMEAGEDPAQCAGRELEEETGYAAGKIAPLCAFFTAPGLTTEYMHVFLATQLSQTAQRLDPTEQIRVEVMGLSDALAAASDGRIVDAKTIAALAVYDYRGARAV